MATKVTRDALQKNLESGGTWKGSTSSSKRDKLQENLESMYPDIGYTQQNVSAYDSWKKMMDASQKQYDTARAKTTIGSRWNNFKGTVSDYFKKLDQWNSDNPWIGLATDPDMAEQLSTSGPRPSLGADLKAMKTKNKANEDAAYNAWKEKEDLRNQEIGAKLVSEMTEAGYTQVGSLIRDYKHNVAVAQRQGNQKQAEYWQAKIDEYTPFWEAEQKQVEQSKWVSDYERTQKGYTDFDDYRAKLSMLGGYENVGKSIDTMGRLNAGLGGEGMSDAERAAREADADRYYSQYGDVQDPYNLYGDTQFQRDAGYLEAEDKYQAALKDWEELDEQYHNMPGVEIYNSAYSEEQFNRDVNAAAEYAADMVENGDENGNKWTWDQYEQYVDEQTALAKQRLENSDSGVVNGPDREALAKQLEEAAKELEKAKYIRDYAKSRRNGEPDGARGYASFFGDSSFKDAVENGKKAYEEYNTGLGDFPTKQAQDEYNQRWQYEYDRQIEMGADDYNARIAADSVAEAWRNGTQANSSYWDPEWNNRYKPTDEWSKEELENFYWYFGEGSPERAFQYAADVNQKYNKEEAEEAALKRFYQMDSAPPLAKWVLGAGKTVLAGAERLGFGTYDWLRMVAEGAYNDGVLTESQYQGLSRDAENITSAIVQEIMRNHPDTILPEEYSWVPLVGDMTPAELYQNWSSHVDSVLAMLLSGGSAGAINAMFFGSAASSTMREDIESGRDWRSSVLHSGGAGFAEGIGETVSLEFLLHTKMGQKYIKGFLQAIVAPAIEGSEEVVTDWIDRWVDEKTNKAESDYQQTIQQYIVNNPGMTYEQAKKLADKDWQEQLYDSFSAGALSMLMTAGAGAGAAGVRNVGANAVSYTGQYGISAEGLANAASIQGTDKGSQRQKTLADKYIQRFYDNGKMSLRNAEKIMGAMGANIDLTGASKASSRYKAFVKGLTEITDSGTGTPGIKQEAQQEAEPITEENYPEKVEAQMQEPVVEKPGVTKPVTNVSDAKTGGSAMSLDQEDEGKTPEEVEAILNAELAKENGEQETEAKQKQEPVVGKPEQQKTVKGQVTDSGTGGSAVELGTEGERDEEIYEEAQNFVKTFTQGPTAITDSGTSAREPAEKKQNPEMNMNRTRTDVSDSGTGTVRQEAEQAAIDAYNAVMQGPTAVTDSGTGTSELAKRQQAEQAAIDAYYQAMADANAAAAKPRKGEPVVGKPEAEKTVEGQVTDSGTGGSPADFSHKPQMQDAAVEKPGVTKPSTLTGEQTDEKTGGSAADFSHKPQKQEAVVGKPEQEKTVEGQVTDANTGGSEVHFNNEEAAQEREQKPEQEQKEEEPITREEIDTAKKVLEWLKSGTGDPPIKGLTRERAETMLYDLAKDLGVDFSNKPGLKTASKFDVAYTRASQVLQALDRIERKTSEVKARMGENDKTKDIQKGNVNEINLDGENWKVGEAKYNPKDGSTTFELTGPDGKARILKESEMMDELKAMYELLKNHLGSDAAEAWNWMRPDQSVYTYAIAFRNMRQNGYYNVQQAQAFQNKGVLTDAQANQAYNLGRARTSREGGTPIRYRKGTGKMSFNGGNLNGRQMKAVKDVAALQRSQQYKEAEAAARALEIDVVFYESETDDDRYYVGAQGAFQNGVIWLDVNAGMIRAADKKGKNAIGEKLYLTTMSHELTHFIARSAPEQYKALQDKVMEYLLKKEGVDFNSIIRSKLARASVNLSYDDAMEEVIADACESMLVNSQYIQDIAREKPGLFDTIYNFIKRFNDRILSSYAPHAEAQALEPILKEVQKLWDNGLKYAVENRITGNNEQKAVDKLGKEAETHYSDRGELLAAQSEDGNTVLYSERTYLNGGREKLRQILKQNGHTAEEVNQTLKDLDRQMQFLHDLGNEYAVNMGYEALANHLQADITTYIKSGEKATQALSTLVNNGEYPVNLDLALICKKRVAYMRMMTKLIEDGVFSKVNFQGAAIADVNTILRNNGFETACLGCFVEARRLQLQKWAETIVKEWNAAVDQRNPDAGYFGFSEGLEEFSADDVLRFTQELEEAGEKNDKGNVKLNSKAVAKKMGELQDRVPSLQKKLTIADLLTPKGMSMLRSYDQNLFSLVKQRYGAASPKIVQEFNPYNSEVADLGFDYVKEMTGNAVKGAREFLKQAKEQNPQKPGESNEDYEERVETIALRNYLYKIGGARIQSFSDFMIENLFDYLQILNDLAARELPMHGYSKEASFVRLFGMTGIKINGSWIAHTERSMGKERAGLLPVEEASNGRGIVVTVDGEQYAICMDDYARNQATGSFIQSIGMKDMVALQLDPRYSANVGSITIGVSDKQIRAMLDSDYFRMVIPYHASGMLKIFAELVGVDSYNDYTNYQNTKVKSVRLTGKGQVQLKTNSKTGKQKVLNASGKELSVDTSFAYNEAVQRLGDARAAADEYLRWCADDTQHPVYDGDTIIGYATFSPKFSSSPYGYDFTTHPNYYKLLEDFNSYDMNGESALQGAAQVVLPSEENRMTPEQMEAYKQALRNTGLFTEKEIEKYAKKADMTFEELVREEVQGRAVYESTQAEVWDKTVEEVEKTLLENHPRNKPAAKKKASQKSKAKMSDRDYSYDQFSASDYYTDGRMYDYDFLVAQKPMIVRDMPPLSDVKVNGKVSQEKAVELGLKNAASIGREVSDTVYMVKNTYTGREIQVSGGSLEHSVDPGKDNNIGRLRTNARISAIGGYVVQNGIPINGLENEKSAKTQVKGTYALACLLNSGDRQVVAIATIEQVTNSLVNLGYVDVAHAFSGRIKKDGASSTRENGQRPTASISEINIADFLDIVKDTYHSILSVSVLNHFGKHFSEPGNYTGNVRFSERDDARTDRDLLMEASEAKLSPEEKKALKDYRALVEDYKERERKVQAALDALEQMVRTHSPDVQKQRSKVSSLQAGMQRALKNLTAAEQGKALLEIIRKEREIQRKRTAYATRETFTKRDLRARITRLYNDLNRRITNPSEKKNIPVPVMEQAIEVLQAINMDSSREGSKAGEKLRNKLLNLKQKYETLQNDSDFRTAAVYDPVVAELLDKMVEEVGETPINKMSAYQMKTVLDALTALDKTARKALVIKMMGEERDAYQVAKQMGEETQSVTKPHKNLFEQWINAQLSPERMFNRLGGYKMNGAWNQVYRMLDDGQLRQLQIQMEGTMIFDDLLKGKNYDRFIDPKETLDIGLKDKNGKAIPITRGMMVALYLHLQNEDNVRHIQYGGLTVPNLKDYYNRRNSSGMDSAVRAVGFSEQLSDLSHELRQAQTKEEKDAIRLQIEEVEAQADDYIDGLRESIEKKLTEYDRRWIAAAKELFDVYSKSRINETTMDVYGIKRANVDNYFPIWVDGDFLNTPFESIAKDMSLENAGFVKERVSSGKPIRLADVSDVASTQIRRVSQYCGLMPVVRNFQKIWGKVQTGYAGSLQADVRDKFGTAGLNYVENLMADLNGARKGRGGPLDELLNTLRGHMARASLTLSLRTAFGQAASYPTAASVIGWEPLTKALATHKNAQKRAELIRKYSPMMWYRMKGYSTTELGDIAGSNSKFDRLWKKMHVVTGWIQAMDVATVGKLWDAAEIYVSDNTTLQKGTDAYYQKVAETFNTIIEKSQPNYTTLQRPDILRNPSTLVKQLTMFLTQRLQNFNILYDSAATYSQARKDFKAGSVTAQQLGEARRNVRRAVASQIAAAATIVAFKALADAILHSMNAYRDDDKELTAESISMELLDMFLDSLTGNMLGGSELYDIIESKVFGKTYYGVEISSISTVMDMVESANKFAESVQKGIEEGKSAKDIILSKQANTLAKNISTLLGIPLGNGEKIVNGMIYHIEDAMNGEFLHYEAGVERTTAQQAHRLYRAYASANFGTAKKIREQVGDDEKLNAALVTYIKKQYQEGKISKAEAQKELVKWADVRQADAEKSIREYSCFVDTGIAYSKIGESFVEGKITAVQAKKMLMKYGEKSSEDADKMIEQYKCEKATGIKYSMIDDDLRDGRISEAKAAQMWVTYGGMDKVKAEAKASFIVYQNKNPNTTLESASYLTWYTKYRSILTASQYESYDTKMKACKGKDKDGDGKADSGSVKKQKLKVIDSLPISNKEKDELYLINGWSQNTIKDAPWHK